MSGLGKSVFQLAFQSSPIILVDGIATGLPTGSMLPIIAITEPLNLLGGILTGGDLSPDNFFASFSPVPGATLIDQQVGHYPFANQAVAANAVIAQPLTISLKMTCPVRLGLGYFTKLATMITLQTVLAKHNGMGGTYIIATPSFFYTNCIMLRMSDVSGGDSNQVQTTWQLDFEKPLLTLNDAQEAQSSLLQKLTNGTKILGIPLWSGFESLLGDAGSLGGIGSVQSAQGVAGAAIPPS